MELSYLQMETFPNIKDSRSRAEYLYRDQFGYLTDTTLGTSTRLDRSQDGLYIRAFTSGTAGNWEGRYDTLNLIQE